MKNKPFIKNTKSVIMIFVMMFFFSHCKENIEEPKKKTAINNESYDNQIAYTEQNFKILAQNTLKFSNDPVFRQNLYSEIEKQFDGDNNVLFETLLNVSTSNESSLKSRIASSKHNDIFIDAINAFKGIDTVDFYPQIYIPFYESLKEKRVVANTRVSSIQKNPVIIFFTGDDSQKTFDGYQLNDNGELEKVGFLIDEEYAQNNEVWVISLNERFFGDTNKLNQNKNQRISSSPSAYIKNIACKCHMESWANGGSEVHIITIFSDWKFYNMDANVTESNKNEGLLIREFSRNQVKNKQNFTQYYPMINSWNTRAPNKVYANYVIFEYDSWPVEKRKVSWWHDNVELTWEYRSSDIHYAKNTVPQSQMNTHSVSSGCMDLTTAYE